MTRDRMNQLLDSAGRHLIQNYKPQPIVLTRGEGRHLGTSPAIATST